MRLSWTLNGVFIFQTHRQSRSSTIHDKRWQLFLTSNAWLSCKPTVPVPRSNSNWERDTPRDISNHHPLSYSDRLVVAIEEVHPTIHPSDWLNKLCAHPHLVGVRTGLDSSCYKIGSTSQIHFCILNKTAGITTDCRDPSVEWVREYNIFVCRVNKWTGVEPRGWYADKLTNLWTIFIVKSKSDL